jgi:hypothetical protein
MFPARGFRDAPLTYAAAGRQPAPVVSTGVTGAAREQDLPSHNSCAARAQLERHALHSAAANF